MDAERRQKVLLVGATGRTGGRVLQQLLTRGVDVRAIVRSSARLPEGVAGHPRLEVVEASLLSLGAEELSRLLRGCDAVVSCLGHPLSLAGVFGPPRDLVARAVARLCQGVEGLAPAAPVKLVLMSSVSVHRPGRSDARRGRLERAFLRVLCCLVPAARDNQRAADHLFDEVGTGSTSLQWAVVRPDTLLGGEVSPYALHEGLVDGIFKPGKSSMANVAHFMCELVTNPAAWAAWQGKAPVVVNA